jgi:Spy/CpxP family protein refolding chaperone
MKLNRRCGMLLASLASIGVGTAVSAFAQPETSPGTAPGTDTQHRVAPRTRMTAEPRTMLLHLTVHAAEELHLTAEQKGQIRMIMRNAQEQERVNRSTTRPDIAVLGDPTNPGYSAAIQALKTNATNRVQQESDFQTQVVNVLTPEQKTKLPTVLASMQAKAEAHRAASAEHPAGSLR